MISKKRDRENVLLREKNSRKIYIPFYLMVLILVGIVLFLSSRGIGLSTFAWVVVVLFVFFIVKLTEIHRLSNIYEITPHALVHSSGIVSKNIKKIDFFAISDLDIIQNPWQRLFNYGDIRVRLFSVDTTTHLKNLNNPESFADFLEKTINKKRMQTSGADNGDN